MERNFYRNVLNFRFESGGFRAVLLGKLKQRQVTIEKRAQISLHLPLIEFQGLLN